VQLLPWTPFCPCASAATGRFRKLVFVGASPTRGLHFNGDHDVTAASRPVKAFVPVRIRLVTPISMGRSLLLQNEGVVAHRERAAGRESGVAGSIPACEAPYLRHHLSIESFRRAAELGLSAKALQWASRFKPCATGQPVDGPTRFLSVANFIGPKAVGYLTQLVECRPCKPEAAGSTPASDAVLARCCSISTGRRIGLSLDTRVVAGSSPAFGSRCRSSSEVEHV
jgi:hypothetical protein